MLSRSNHTTIENSIYKKIDICYMILAVFTAYMSDSTNPSLQRNVWLSYLISFLNKLGFFGPVAALFYLDWVHLNYTQMFIAEAIFSATVFLFEIPTGIIADKFGRKTSIILSGVFTTVGIYIFANSTSFLFIIVAQIIWGIGVTLLSGADNALLYDSLLELKEEKESKKYFARQDAAGTVGTVLGALVGGWFITKTFVPYPSSLSVTFLLTCIPIGLGVLIAFLLREPKREFKSKEKFMRLGWDGFKFLFQHKELRLLSFNFALIGASTYFMFWFYQTLTQSVGLGIGYNGIISACYNIAAVVLLMNVTKIEKWFGMNRILFYSALIPGLFYLILGFCNNWILAVTGIFVIMCLKVIRLPLLSHFINQHIESAQRATVLSGVSMLQRLCILALYPIAGLIADISLQYVFIFLGIATVFFAIISCVQIAQDS